MKENDGYETVLDVDMANDESDSVQIVAKRDGSIITEILVLAKDNEEKEIILVMMSGKLDESDLAELIKQQNK